MATAIELTPFLDNTKLWSLTGSGSHGFQLEPRNTKEYLEEIFAWSRYSKSDVANLIGLSRTTLYSHLDGSSNSAQAITHNKIVHLHLLLTSYIVEGGDLQVDFLRTKLPDGATLAEKLEGETIHTQLTDEERATLIAIAKRSQLKVRSRESLERKFT